MNKKILDNGNAIITDEITPKEIANRLDKNFDDSNCLVCECDDGTPDEIAEKIMNKHDKDSQINMDKTKDNDFDGLHHVEKVNIQDMGNKIHESRKNKLPKYNIDLV